MSFQSPPERGKCELTEKMYSDHPPTAMTTREDDGDLILFMRISQEIVTPLAPVWLFQLVVGWQL